MAPHKLFENESLSGKLFVICSLSVIILTVLALMFGIFYFGFLGLFNLLGIQYDNLLALFLFTLLFLIFSCFADVFEKLVRMLLKDILIEQNRILNYIILFISYSAINLTVISTLDYFMQSIVIQFITQIVISMLLALLDIATD
ncbi:YrvL family regulatory protein [Sporolactobacillus kofuensis]|uniref:YrvL family regulatory protein n=1 Tax=Sporolactobacillus kofuensis TaxID=269672 RepID=A0ABW1WCU4_9BACL|nr:YrvL family regulatory protein [Sporolactobacillus kofuensis]MCO7175491.1 regulatory YrvL family protein [Sporolactobacillus kofuensis]